VPSNKIRKPHRKAPSARATSLVISRRPAMVQKFKRVPPSQNSVPVGPYGRKREKRTESVQTREAVEMIQEVEKLMRPVTDLSKRYEMFLCRVVEYVKYFLDLLWFWPASQSTVKFYF
jgi:hypothetical protein